MTREKDVRYDERTLLSKGNECTLLFRVNNIRFRVGGEKSAVCERESIVCSEEICENTWEEEGEGGGEERERCWLGSWIEGVLFGRWRKQTTRYRQSSIDVL